MLIFHLQKKDIDVEMKGIILMLGLITAFIFIYFMRVTKECPAQPFVTQEQTEGLTG